MVPLKAKNLNNAKLSNDSQVAVAASPQAASPVPVAKVPINAKNVESKDKVLTFLVLFDKVPSNANKLYKDKVLAIRCQLPPRPPPVLR